MISLSRALTRGSARCTRRSSAYRMLSSVGNSQKFEEALSTTPVLASAAVVLAAGAASAWNASQDSDYPFMTKLDAGVGVGAPAAEISEDDDEEEASPNENDNKDDNTTDVINWSGTHKVTIDNNKLFEPESLEELEDFVRACHAQGQAIRPLGSSLSPNGIALNADGMVSMANLDKVLEIDTKNKTVTVQAGITVQRVVEALRPHGLTLPNLASIAEQQMGGFIQVGAHGTGRQIAPVDHYVKKLKLVTPGLGTITLTKEENGIIFDLAKVAMGCLGVVVEVTMECIPAHDLVEHTFVLTRKEATEQLEHLLKNHKHMRYMWIPYTDSVVCVTNDPDDKSYFRRKAPSPASAEQRMKPLTDLLAQLHEEHDKPFSKEEVQGMGFGELRDALLAFAPLDIEHVKRCNKAEAEFWKRNEGTQTKPSDQLLQFDCGGQQWVYEVCFPTGTQEEDNGNDIKFMENLLDAIEKHNIPAHSPIEQRWTASSSSLMSPAYGPPDGMHTWVGIINYLPSDDPVQRQEITDGFIGAYSDLVRTIGKPMSSVSHWAKLEEPTSIWKAIDLKLFYLERFPVKEFNEARAKLDPKNILSNPLLDLVLGTPIP